MKETIRLGLVGDNIALSKSPRLHRLAGRQNERNVTFDLLVPAAENMAFPDLFDSLPGRGYRGVSITYPYKEDAARRVVINDPLVRAIGAVNTVVFDEDGPHGFNTDYTGFIAAYRQARPSAGPGDVLMIGAGGVGRAIAFGLANLGMTHLRLADRDPSKAEALAAALRQACPELKVTTGSDADDLASGMTGIVNCSPVGMVGHAGTPLHRQRMKGAEWAFDAVYTPVDTQFLAEAAAEGLLAISGDKLFFAQGVNAWRIFTGLPLDEEKLRLALNSADDIAS